MRSNCRRCPSGVSLIEVLVTMAVLAVVMLVTADLIRSSRRASQNLAQVEQGDLLNRALLDLVQQLDAAVEISLPTRGGSSDTLVFRRVNPGVDQPTPVRLPSTWEPAPAPIPSGGWDPLEAAWLHVVSVGLDSQNALLWTQGDNLRTLASGLSGFQCTSQNGLLSLTGSVLQGQRLRTYRVDYCVQPQVSWP